MFDIEINAMKLVRGKEGFSTLVDAFEDRENGNVFVMEFVAG